MTTLILKMNNGASRVSLRQHNPICAYLRLSRVNGGAYKSEGIRAPPEGQRHSKSRNLYGAQAIQICELVFLVRFCQQKLRFCQRGEAIFLENKGLYYKCLSGRTISAFRNYILKEIIYAAVKSYNNRKRDI